MSDAFSSVNEVTGPEITHSAATAKNRKTRDARTSRPPQAKLTKVSANFVRRSVVALQAASEITGDNQTDVLNRSIQLYAYIMKMVDEGKLILIDDPSAGTRERLTLV